MTAQEFAHPQIVSRDEWLAARETLLVHEKELTKHQDKISAERRRLPMVKVEKTYTFNGSEGKRSLYDLLDLLHKCAIIGACDTKPYKNSTMKTSNVALASSATPLNKCWQS